MVAAAAACALSVGVVSAKSTSYLKGCHSVKCDARARALCASHAACRGRVQRKRWHRTADPYWGIFAAIETCERGAAGWRTDTGNGFYGGLQFTMQSWRGVGGRGNPASASQLEQIYRAVLLMRRQGYGAWPVCRSVAAV